MLMCSVLVDMNAVKDRNHINLVLNHEIPAFAGI